MKLTGFLTCLLGLAIALTTHATTVPYKNFDELIDESEHVIGGFVESVHSEQHKAGIFSIITFKNAYLITASGNRSLEKKVKIRYEGGEISMFDEKGESIGTETLHLHGTPEFEKGEEVILFIAKNGVARMPIYGWGQGVFRIDQDRGVLDAGGSPVVSIKGADIVTKNNRGLVVQGQVFQGETFQYSGSDSPYILSSEGGDDLIDSAYLGTKNGKELTEKDLDLSHYQTMDVYEFESIIQERKATRENEKLMQGISIIEVDIKNLFTLPEMKDIKALEVDQVYRGNDFPVVESQGNQGSIDSEPVLPLPTPKTEPDGQ